jgi:hypothetical protein
MPLLGYFGHSDTNCKDLICVASPKVTKASRVLIDRAMEISQFLNAGRVLLSLAVDKPYLYVMGHFSRQCYGPVGLNSKWAGMLKLYATQVC